MSYSSIQQKELNNYIDLTFEILKRLNDASCKSSIMKGEYESCCQDFFYNNLFLLILYSTFNGFDDQTRNIIKQRYDNLNLYHYTSYESLVSILCTKKLKLNCVLNTSDSQEVKRLINNLKKSIKDNQLLSQIKIKFEETLRSVYFFSFKVLANDASLWEIYTKSKNTQSKNSAGVACTQFSKTNLKELIKNLKKGLNFIDFTPILYTDNESSIFLEVIKKVIKTVSFEESLSPKEQLELFKVYSCSIKREQFSQNAKLDY